MATIKYSVTLPIFEVRNRAAAVLSYWAAEGERISERMRSIGPRPKDERSHLSDWSKLERDRKIVGEHIWDAKIAIAGFSVCDDIEITLSSDELRWFYPDLEPDDSDLIQSE
jgi:hypothetical protein